MLKKMKNELKAAPKVINIITDMWTASHGSLPYITVHVRFCDDDLKVRNYSLKTEYLPRPHTGEAIKASIKRTLQEFGLGDRLIIGVGDGGANVKKAGRIYEEMLVYLPCKLHGTHNGLTKDVEKFGPWKDVVLPLFSLLRKITQTLCYRGHLMNETHLKMQAEEFKAFIVSNDQLLEELTTDELIPEYDGVLAEDEPITESQSEYEFTQENSQYELETLGLPHDDQIFTRMAVVDSKLQHEYEKYCAKLDKPARLHKQNATRWTSTANMVESFLKNFGKIIIANPKNFISHLSNCFVISLQMSLTSCWPKPVLTNMRNLN
jgi:hypothetical protein